MTQVTAAKGTGAIQTDETEPRLEDSKISVSPRFAALYELEAWVGEESVSIEVRERVRHLSLLAFVAHGDQSLHAGISTLDICKRYVPGDDHAYVLDLINKYKIDFPAVFALLAFTDHLDSEMIAAACHRKPELIDALPIDYGAWQRFLELEPEFGVQMQNVSRVLSLIDPDTESVNDMFSLKEVITHSAVYGSFYEHLGDMTVSFMLDGVAAAETALDHLPFFTEAAAIINADARFSDEDKREALFFFPHRRINEIGFKEAMLPLIRTFGADATHCYLAVREADDAVDAAQLCIAMDRTLKGNSIEIFKAYDEEAISVYKKYWPFFQGMVSRLEKVGHSHVCQQVFELCCHPGLIDDFGEILLTIAGSPELAPGVHTAAITFDYMRRHRIDGDSLVPKILELMRVSSTSLGNLLNGLLPEVVEKHFGFVKRAYELDVYNAGRTLRAMPWEEYEINPAPYDAVLEAWKQSAWGVITAFKESGFKDLTEFLNTYGREAVTIRRSCKSASGKLFASMPANQWAGLGVAYAEAFGMSAGWVLDRVISALEENPPAQPCLFWLLDSERFRNAFEVNKSHMGIHRVERYLGQGIVIRSEMDTPTEDKLLFLLEENARCLDPNYKKERKLAVVVMPHYDGNGAFRKRAHAEFKQLDGLGYKVVFCEAGSGKGAIDAARRVVELHRSVEGEVAKGAHYVALLAHANFDFSAWGDPEDRDGKSYLAKDLEEDLRFKDILHPDHPIINLGGCFVGRGGRKAENLGRILNQWNRGVTLFANAGSLAPRSFVLDESGSKIVGLTHLRAEADGDILGGEGLTRFYF